jgi:phosphoribosylanthranilate isomerase
MMQPVLRPRVKICCIASLEEAWLAIKYGVSAVGLVSEMPSGPGPIPESLIAKIAIALPPSVSSFLLTSKQEPSEIVMQHRRCRTSVIQLVDRLKIGDYRKLREAMPGVGLVQVVHVTGEGAVDEAVAVAPHVNGILLDSGKPDLRVKQLGGTGRLHDWGLSRRIREGAKVPVFLAGGLSPDNVLEGLNQVQPFGVDVCNGVRTENRLDEGKLSAFFEAVWSYVPTKLEEREQQKGKRDRRRRGG